MYQTIPHRSTANVALFWICDIKVGVGAGLIGKGREFFLKLKNMIFEVALESLNIFSFLLASFKPGPAFKKEIDCI